MEYVILDIETTGLDKEHSSIIEIAAILVEKGGVKNSYSSFVHYDGVLSETVKRLTGIQEEDTQKSSTNSCCHF